MLKSEDDRDHEDSPVLHPDHPSSAPQTPPASSASSSSSAVPALLQHYNNTAAAAAAAASHNNPTSCLQCKSAKHRCDLKEGVFPCSR
jgi:hypothetical protein